MIPEWTFERSEPDPFTDHVTEVATVQGIIFDTPNFVADRMARLGVTCARQRKLTGFLIAPAAYMGPSPRTRAYFKVDDSQAFRRVVSKTRGRDGLILDGEVMAELYDLWAAGNVLMVRVDSEGHRYDFEFSLTGFVQAASHLTCAP